MVIVNPKLSLPIDLPYKKRQRQFLPHANLQQATIRYNEAIRKKYNDMQFAKRLENGSATQNEIMGVNTIEISKMVDPALFLEMSNANPLSVSLLKKRKSKGFDGSPIRHSCRTLEDIGSTSRPGCRQDSKCLDNGRRLNSSAVGTESSNNASFDCNNTEMFPHLQSTLNTENEKTGPSPTYFTGNIKPPSSNSLETQAINEYEPAIDSAHDMIFGNVMGMDYGNYIHGPLWPAQQQGFVGNINGGVNDQSAPCSLGKLSGSGYNQPPTMPSPLLHSVAPPLLYGNVHQNENENVLNPLPVMGKHPPCGAPSGPGRRSTSVPRPRTGTQKETLKQAAIRCGIIKGNLTVASIPKRSHCLAPLQLTPVQSDPVVSVVEILHPKGTLATCSSEALVDFEDYRFKSGSVDSFDSEAIVVHNNKSTPALNIVMNVLGDGTKDDIIDDRVRTEKSISEGHGQGTVEPDLVSDGRALENTRSCPTL